ncbi:SDR family oxidoreductase [Propionibacterium sp.]|uniref:SDR family oxidoreductase n=1 Tax=Propionibacterium sp. TaxID=1977903 RepID=UPI0039E9CF1E
MNPTPPTVLVIGASGRVGGEVCRQLRAAGAQVRVATRHPQAIIANGHAATMAVDLTDPATLEPALKDVDAVHLMWPFFDTAEDARRKVTPIAQQLGSSVPRVVYLSSQAVEDDPQSFWAVVEDALTAEVEEWTMLRPTGFAFNAQQWVPQIVSGDTVRWPFGQMSRPLIHERDIAAVAVKALLEEGHQARRYVLTGPESLTQQKQVQLIGAAISRPLRWQEIDRARAQREYGIPDVLLDAWENFLSRPEPVTDEVARLLGRAALSFSDWAHDHADLFR